MYNTTRTGILIQLGCGAGRRAILSNLHQRLDFRQGSDGSGALEYVYVASRPRDHASPAEVVRKTPVSQAPNGICYAVSGELIISENDLERMVAAVPNAAAGALSRKAYYFVPLTVNQGDDTVIADRYDVAPQRQRSVPPQS